MAGNPYLQGQQDAIRNTVNTSLQQQQLPGINRGAVLNGGYGGSRQGVAQGLAMNGANTAIANATAQMQGQAYDADANRSLQQSMQQAQLGSQERIASQNDATQRYGLGNQYALGMGNLGLGYTQANQNFALGQGNLGLGYQNSNNQYALGNKQADQSYALGAGNLGLGFQNSNNQYALGQQQNANTAQATQNQYTLGLGNLGLGNKQADQSFALGQQSNSNQLTGLQNQFALGQQQNATTRDLGFGQLGNAATANNQNFYTQQRGQDLAQQGQGFNQYLAALNAQLGIGSQISNIGQQQFNAPGTVLGQYGNMVSPFTGLNSTDTRNTPSSGGGLAGAAGGALTLAQLYNLLNQPAKP